MDGEERVKAAVEHIVKTLGTNNESMTEDMIEIFAQYDVRFNDLLRKNSEQTSKEQLDGFSGALNEAEEVILGWERRAPTTSSDRMVWDSEEDAAGYLHAVDECQNIWDSFLLAERRAGIDRAVMDRAKSLLDKSMLRLNDEFKCLLDRHGGPVDREELLRSFATSSSIAGTSFTREDAGVSGVDAGVSDDEDDDDDDDVPVAQPVTDLNPLMDLLPDEVIRDLHDIAKRMIQAGYKNQCIRVYATSRKMAMDDTLRGLGFERLSFDEIQKMQWDALHNKIQGWIQIMNVGVKVVVASERQLCDQVFENLTVEDVVFAELAKGTMMQLLGFGESIASGKRSTDKLVALLDMYEKLRDLLPEIDSAFAGEACVSVREEAAGVVLRLGQAARGTFAEFENAIYRDPPNSPVPGGALHPLTRFVMNYLRLLVVYLDTLKQLFGGRTTVPGELNGHHGGSTSGYTEDEGESSSPLAKQFVVIIHVLENNLDNKAKLYKDLSLTNLFLMNNAHYILQKVKDCDEIKALLGDEWIRKHTLQVRQHGANYERSSWVKVLSFLKDEGIRTSGTSFGSVSKAVLKDRFKSFNAAFDEIHRTQSNWCVPNEQLNSELRISIAEKLVPAYRGFLGRYRIYLDRERHPDRYIKYSPEDLEARINDLFARRP